MKLLQPDRSIKELTRKPRRYAILSHTWGDDEITYADVQDGRTNHSGYRKLCGFVKTANKDGYGHFWMDNVCIDSRNYSELSESINSMFKWYEDADLCYVYLDDFEWLEEEKHAGKTTVSDIQEREWVRRFWNCRWFTRAWTLQELIAARNLVFYDRNWIKFNAFVTTEALLCVIEARTQVPRSLLCKERTLKSFNIATKMSWAARRQATKPEDIAYSLLGMFDVNMPLIYGEGREKAFLRLQKEILANSDDESIFSWEAKGGCLGLLAQSPDQFQSRPDMKPINLATQPWTQTNVGLQVTLSMEETKEVYPRRYTVYLNCIDTKTGYCPSFRFSQVAEQEHARSGTLRWRAFPISNATALRKEVFVRQDQIPHAPLVRFDISAPKDRFRWQGDWPRYGWTTRSDHAMCDRPILVENSDLYSATVQLTDKTEGGGTCAVTILLNWDPKAASWYCRPGIHRRKADVRKAVDEVFRVASDGTVSCVYKLPGGSLITASVPASIEWHHAMVCANVVATLDTDGDGDTTALEGGPDESGTSADEAEAAADLEELESAAVEALRRQFQST